MISDVSTDSPVVRSESPDAESDACSLCELPTPAEPFTADDVDGAYCCRGCLEVSRALGGPERAAESDIEQSLAAATDADDVPAATDADDVPDDAARTFLSVDGMHCATCETFIESTAVGDDGVYAAEASYATDMLRVTYDPDETDLDGLVGRLGRYGYDATDPDAAAETDEGSGLAKFLIGGGVFGMMVMVWYVLFLYPTYLGFDPVVDLGAFDGLYVVANVWVMSSIVLFYTGYPILRGAYVSLAARQPNMDLLVALAAVAAYVFSVGSMVVGRTHVYFDVSVAIVLVVTLGNYYEDRIKRRAATRLTDLTSARVTDATRLSDDGRTESVPVESIRPDDRILVRPGERVPVDGVVVEGRAAVDESLVTGESIPTTREPGDSVIGGSVVTDDALTVEVGDDATSTLDRLVELLWEIQSSRGGAQRLADKLATVFVPLVLALSVLTTAGFLVLGSSPTDALLNGLTVLIVSCPCALGLATPLAVASGVRDAADSGVVVASDAVFEDAPDADTIIFDKTGTLTDGRMRVRGVTTAAADETTALELAAAVERYASHPLAEALVQCAPDRLPTVTDSTVHQRGVTGRVDGTDIVVGHPSLLREAGVTVPDELASAGESVRDAGRVPVFVGWDRSARAVFDVGDAPREMWDETLSELGAERELVVLTGDDERAAAQFRSHPAVDEVFAGVPPEAKAETVERFRSRGTVAMVGDGSNDAPALAAADVGIAFGSGTDLAGSAADAIIVERGLDAVPTVFSVAAGTHRRIRENLAWAFVYNLVAIPLAISGLINPLLAAVAMGTSSLLVVVNSARSVE
ncbi:cation-translocating P-type ATPase [Halogeometricum borinquense]|uniref:Cation-translocating P-type ATPase n=1 Tax=Halogeometricum borinquense TaxID=60847 RepID=A0A482T6R9_9EURY|nr:cation-translocating P-type ATPase [Halogeometricum borinquense]